MSVVPVSAGLASDETRDGDALFQLTHEHQYGYVDQQINDRGCGEGFEDLERELTHGPRAGGQLQQADRQGDGAVFYDVQAFAAHRWQHDAKRHWKQHVTVGLRQGESERVAS